MLRLGVIGCGDIAKYVLMFAKLNRNIQIVACADIQIERACKAASRFKGAKAYDNYLEMIEDLNMDAVYLAVPHYLHYPIMKKLITKGLHVLCEKPVATKLEDAVEIMNLAKANQIKVGINYQYRYDKACYRMVMAARKGDLGALYYGICNIPWHRNADYFKVSPWHSSVEQAGGGTLITQGSHGLDVLLWSFGVKAIQAQGVTRQVMFTAVEVEDVCMGIVLLENGCTLQITSSMVANREQPMTISIYGSKGTAIYTGASLSKVKFIGAKVPNYAPKASGVHALARSLEAFRQWIQFDDPYNNSIEEAIPVLAVAQAIYRSAETKITETVLT